MNTENKSPRTILTVIGARLQSEFGRLAVRLERPLAKTEAIVVLSTILAAILLSTAYLSLMSSHYRQTITLQKRFSSQTAYLSDQVDYMERRLSLMADETAARQDTYRQMISILEAYGTDIPIGDRQAFVQFVYHESMKNTLDPILAMALIKVESTFDTMAVSPMGAVGLMQVIPYVGKSKAEDLGIPWNGEDTLYDPYHNVRIGLAYLMDLRSQFRDFSLALEAYNRGPTALRESLTAGINPSRYYAKRVLGVYTRFQRI